MAISVSSQPYPSLAPLPMSNAITPDLVSVSSPSVSPDDVRVAFSRSEYDLERKETRSQIMVPELPGGEPRPFTQGTNAGSSRSWPRSSSDD